MREDEKGWVNQQMHHLQRSLCNGGSHARNLTDYTKIVLHRAMLLPHCTYRLRAGDSCSHDSGVPSGGVVENGVSYCLTWKLWLPEQAQSILHVPYSGKLSQIGEKYNFRRENFRGLLAFATPKDATPPNFAEKTFADSHKSAKFAKVFSLESFPLYGSQWTYIYTQMSIHIHFTCGSPKQNLNIIPLRILSAFDVV